MPKEPMNPAALPEVPRRRRRIDSQVSKGNISYQELLGIHLRQCRIKNLAKLEKNSIISKGIHPVPQVESFKCNLRSRGYLKDCSTHWELKKPLFTGLLMALNLHNGYLVEKNYLCDDIFVSKYDAEQLEGTLPENNLCRSDSDIIKKIDRDTLKLDNFFGMHVNKDFLVNHGSDDFGADEKFALKIMQQQGIISTNARHGLTSHNEADIIDEESGQQYEVTYEFKTSLSKKKNSAQFDPEICPYRTSFFVSPCYSVF